MSFHQTLKRLREAAGESPFPGDIPDYRRVWVEDLRELLYHFDRLDYEIRDLYAEKIQRELGDGSPEAKEEYKMKVIDRYDHSP